MVVGYKYTEYQVCVGGVLHPIPTPLTSRKVRGVGRNADETTFLCLGLAFEGGLVAVSIHVEGVGGFSIMVVMVIIGIRRTNVVHIIVRGCWAGHIIVSC